MAYDGVLHLLIDRNQGEFIPMIFAQYVKGWRISENDRDILLYGPGNPEYKNTWERVLTYSRYVDSHEKKFKLYQDGDLFAIED